MPPSRTWKYRTVNWRVNPMYLSFDVNVLLFSYAFRIRHYTHFWEACNVLISLNKKRTKMPRLPVRVD